MLPSCSPPLGGGSGASGVLQPSAQHAQQAARLQQLMHSHMNLQMLARMQQVRTTARAARLPCFPSAAAGCFPSLSFHLLPAALAPPFPLLSHGRPCHSQGGGVAAALQSNASLALLPAMGPASCYASPLASPLGSPQLGSPQLGGGAMSPLMACMAAASPEQQEMMMMHLRMQPQHPLPHLQQHPHQPQQQPCIQPMRMLQQPMHVPPPQPPPHPQPQPQPHRHPMPARSTKRSPPLPLRAVATPVAAPPASLVPTIIVGAPAFGSEDAGVIAAASAPPHAVGVTPHAEPASALAAPAVPAESAAVEPGNDRGGASGVQRAPAQLTPPTQGDG